MTCTRPAQTQSTLNPGMEEGMSQNLIPSWWAIGIVLVSGKGESIFFHDTWYIDQTPEQDPCPELVGQHKLAWYFCLFVFLRKSGESWEKKEECRREQVRIYKVGWTGRWSRQMNVIKAHCMRFSEGKISKTLIAIYQVHIKLYIRKSTKIIDKI